MIYALDTNIISYLLRGDNDVTQRWRYERTQGNSQRYRLSHTMKLNVDLQRQAANATIKLNSFERLCAVLGVDTLTLDDVEIASVIYAERKKQGKPIEDADLLIAAQVIARSYTLVTNNAKHFEGINNLNMENWVNA